ncbi:MAG: hypothetical protein KDC13_09920, partial [Bacteroidetes bacterium]|nr:hypothetical protein [Bacteroidota bacterium]
MKLNLLLLILLFPAVYNAQEVEFGKENETKSLRNMPFFLGKVDNVFYTVRVTGYSGSIYMQVMRSDSKAAATAMILGASKFSDDSPFMMQRLFFGQNSHIFLEKYDENLNQISSKEISLRLNPKDDELKVVQFEMAGPNVYCFAYDEEEKGTGNSLKAYPVSEDGKLSAEAILSANYDSENKNVRGKKSHTFRIFPTPDQQHLLITHNFLREPKYPGDRRYLHFAFADQNLKNVWEQDFDIDADYPGMELVTASASNNGDAVFLVKYKNPDSKGPDNLYDVYTWIQA